MRHLGIRRADSSIAIHGHKKHVLGSQSHSYIKNTVAIKFIYNAK
jgi:hypothetical protein